MVSNVSRLRTELARREIDHRRLTDVEVFHLACALRGWHVTPRAEARTRAINARVWLAAALGARGRYRAPETFGHPADLEDGGPLVDSVILMGIVQRHFLAAPELGWGDDALGAALGLDGADLTRAQAVLDAMREIVPRARPPLGAGWWESADERGATAR
jgi:hypothetical protein